MASSVMIAPSSNEKLAGTLIGQRRQPAAVAAGRESVLRQRLCSRQFGLGCRPVGRS